MIRPRRTTISLIAACTVTLAGCSMPKMSVEEFKAMQPTKPPELERLDAFAGKWKAEGTANFAMLDEPLQTTGTSEAQWEGDGWYIVSHGTFTMDDMDEMQGMETWTYDTHSKKYRSTWVDTTGTVATGEGMYDEDTGVWTMRGASYGPHGKSTMTGTVRFVDDDTMEWTWTESAGLMKVLEMSGTSRRVK